MFLHYVSMELPYTSKNVSTDWAESVGKDEVLYMVLRLMAVRCEFGLLLTSVLADKDGIHKYFLTLVDNHFPADFLSVKFSYYDSYSTLVERNPAVSGLFDYTQHFSREGGDCSTLLACVLFSQVRSVTAAGRNLKTTVSSYSSPVSKVTGSRGMAIAFRSLTPFLPPFVGFG